MCSMLDAWGYTWPLSLLCRSRMACMSLWLMALLPRCFALHQSPSSSRYFSIRAPRSEELRLSTMDTAPWDIIIARQQTQRSHARDDDVEFLIIVVMPRRRLNSVGQKKTCHESW